MSTDLQSRFQQATEDSKKLPSRPDNNTLLKLYSLYKQATFGDVSGSRPGGFDMGGKMKDDAWAKEVLDPIRDRVADPRDRGLLTEIVYGVVRRRPTSCFKVSPRLPIVTLEGDYYRNPGDYNLVIEVFPYLTNCPSGIFFAELADEGIVYLVQGFDPEPPSG